MKRICSFSLSDCMQMWFNHRCGCSCGVARSLQFLSVSRTTSNQLFFFQRCVNSELHKIYGIFSDGIASTLDLKGKIDTSGSGHCLCSTLNFVALTAFKPCGCCNPCGLVTHQSDCAIYFGAIAN